MKQIHSSFSACFVCNKQRTRTNKRKKKKLNRNKSNTSTATNHWFWCFNDLAHGFTASTYSKLAFGFRRMKAMHEKRKTRSKKKMKRIRRICLCFFSGFLCDWVAVLQGMPCHLIQTNFIGSISLVIQEQKLIMSRFKYGCNKCIANWNRPITDSMHWFGFGSMNYESSKSGIQPSGTYMSHTHAQLILCRHMVDMQLQDHTSHIKRDQEAKFKSKQLYQQQQNLWSKQL